VRELQSSLGLPRPLCALLAARGLTEPGRAKAFLRPELSALHPPGDLPDLPRAVGRITTAVRDGETILVHGDYDVDGMAGTTLLTRWVRGLGGRVVPFLPHRLRHGYDLGEAGLEAARRAGASLLVSVDCGILAFDAVERARGMGLDVIVTDHHAPGEALPRALAVVNPGRADSSYPNPWLCGTGVVFKLCQGLAEAVGVSQEVLHPYLDLVALATVADLVPLTGENRVLARFGLKAMARTANPGLQALMARAGVDPGSLSARALGFQLAPRLNAVGRLGDPELALRLLLTDDLREAASLAEDADAMNRARQEEDRRTLEEALALLAAGYDPDRDFGVVLASEGWHPGVVGIVASRIVERVHRPVVLVALDGERGRGSARSVPGFHLLDGIRACGSLLERFGGHRQAAGMDIRRDRVEAFREAFNRQARHALEGTDPRPELKADLEVQVAELTADLHRFLRHMGPHGIGNPRPLFLVRGAVAEGAPRVVGEGHLKLRLAQGRSSVEAIGFHLAERIQPAALARGPVDAVFHLQENEYRGVTTLQAGLRDLRPSGGGG
jgi:single-stranded-DNA-specific exonuclease